ncbi:CehA/McbA family metallohydrolase [Haliangium ochraceum]|uniref:PHP domain protein n=1 Tax=Haliangium ochraceum (strain DSM 14365 / JCM 11303 / SMP-2) TaxID=502025 RepID=D0LGS2_HALO1|nr:CehA/McbA family metallohydrolase [Haliangium ochraceum]ACY14644.1 hypothetical protein Hoch_2099 [Haliangium ochraceum DSM 14365]
MRGYTWACAAALCALGANALPGCGDNLGAECEPGAPGCDAGAPPAPSLDQVLPAVPAPTGEPQGAWAGRIGTSDSPDIIPGPGSIGRAGDYVVRNQRARFVVQAPGRAIGVVPYGGNLVDIAALDDRGAARAEDHFGELSLVYQLGRTCEHTSVEIVQDGSGGGVAALRARGRAAVNDYINLRGVGLFDVAESLDPEREDEVACATTYLLAPGSAHLEVWFTLLNPTDTPLSAPLGLLIDSGASTHAWSPGPGFEGSVGLDELLRDAGTEVPYLVQQGPGVAYGVAPRHATAGTSNATFSVTGVSLLLFGARRALEIFDPSRNYLSLAPRTGDSWRVDVAVGRDAAEIGAHLRAAAASADAGDGIAEVELAAQVTWSDGSAAEHARVGLYRDDDDDGAITSDDALVTYLDADAAGAVRGAVPAGNYLARAEVSDRGRSSVITVALAADQPPAALSFLLPAPVLLDYTIRDSDGAVIPARLSIIGAHPAAPDARLFPVGDRAPGTITTVHALRGTSIDRGDGADPALRLPVDADGRARYRVEASRGTEWSAFGTTVELAADSPPAPLEITLERVVDSAGYVASEYHVHQLASTDSVVSQIERVASMAAEGVELFAATDHDAVSDLQPVVEALGISELVRAIPGLEITPFSYGHFNAWPIAPDGTPRGGAIDWARGGGGYAMRPVEIYAAARARGAALVQVNHPRADIGGGRSDFQAHFDRIGLRFDYARGVIESGQGPVPNAWLRLPEGALWSDDFQALEVWNGMQVADTNGDGVREFPGLDLVMRDWFNFLSLGFDVTPLGNSDTHERFRDVAGMPRTYVRVDDDSPQALATGAIVDAVLETLGGRIARDVLVSNGPFLRLTRADDSQSRSVIGAVLEADGDGRVRLELSVEAPHWAQFDTVEVFASATPEVPRPGEPLDETALVPHLCFTARPPAELADNDPCALARGGAQPLQVNQTESAYLAQLRIEVAGENIITRPEARGLDAWLVVRVRGNRGIYPLLLGGIVQDQEAIDTLLDGDADAIDALLDGRGAPATAFTAPVFVDFDGGGYHAPFGPE